MDSAKDPLHTVTACGPFNECCGRPHLFEAMRDASRTDGALSVVSDDSGGKERNTPHTKTRKKAVHYVTPRMLLIR